MAPDLLRRLLPFAAVVAVAGPPDTDLDGLYDGLGQAAELRGGDADRPSQRHVGLGRVSQSDRTS